MTSLGKNARVAGLLYILASVVGVLRLMYIPNKLFVYGNATETAANIAAHESLFRLGIASELHGAALWLFVPLALYRLLKGVDQTLAVLMVILGSLMQVPLFFVSTVSDAAALLFTRGDYLSVFDKPPHKSIHPKELSHPVPDALSSPNGIEMNGATTGVTDLVLNQMHR